MKSKRLFWALGFWAGLAAPLDARVLVNEFVYDPAGADTGNEWVELYNTGASTVSLDGWTLQTDSNKFPGDVKAKLCGTIPPGGYYLIKETEQTLSSATAADFISGTLSMGNATSKADAIQILDNLGIIQDRVVYGSPDSDHLCQNLCSTAPTATNGAGVARSTPGAPTFIAVSSAQASPTAGGGLCTSSEKCPPGSGKVKGLISEVAPSVPSADYVEIFAAERFNPCGARLYENDKLIKTFPPVTLKAPPFGPYLLLHASQKVSAETPDETDATGDLNGNGIADLYSDESSPGLTGGANGNLSLRDTEGGGIDFLSWSLKTDGDYSAGKQSFYDQAAESGLWTPRALSGNPGSYIAGSVRWSNKSTESLSRKIGADGWPQTSRPSSAFDWAVANPTPGKGYDGQIRPRGWRLEVFQSPFSPRGGGRFNEAVIGYKVAEAADVRIEIYDVRGRSVRVLLDNVAAVNDRTQTVYWDGKDEAGLVVPMGIYAVRLHVKNADGSSESETKTVVVGGSL